MKNTLNKTIICGIMLILTASLVSAEDYCVGTPDEGHCYNYDSESVCVSHYYSPSGPWQCGWVEGKCDEIHVCTVPTTTTTIPAAPEFGSPGVLFAILLTMPAFAYIIVKRNR